MSDQELRMPTPPVDPLPATERIAPVSFRAWAPWIAAAVLSLVAVWLLRANVTTYRDLVSARSEAALREVEGRALQQQIEAERIISARRIADLLDEVHPQDNAGRLPVVPLVSRPDAGISPMAVVVLNPGRQEGELVVAGIPVLPADKDYQLWITDPEYGIAASAAVFTVSSMSEGFRVPFKFEKVRAHAGFAISVERKGGADSRQGPVVLSSR